jgi:hypothetical protein
MSVKKIYGTLPKNISKFRRTQPISLIFFAATMAMVVGYVYTNKIGMNRYIWYTNGTPTTLHGQFVRKKGGTFLDFNLRISSNTYRIWDIIVRMSSSTKRLPSWSVVLRKHTYKVDFMF